MRSPISTSSAWTQKEIQAYYTEIERIGLEKLKLDIYPNQIEIISADQMIDAYAFHGMPVMYPHWSFGRDHIFNSQLYNKGKTTLAYELVINSNPCISYLMEENTTMMQITVMAHACMGHNSFFKNNRLMRTWTDAEGIVGYLNFAKKYVEECEQKYGTREVEQVLTACHSLRLWGVDKYKRPQKLSTEQEKIYQKKRVESNQRQINEIWRSLPNANEGWINEEEDQIKEERIPSEPQENILYFLEKTAPHLKEWKRELIRIVRKIAQYFYPNMSTNVMNEGFATFCHYHIVYELYKEGLINDGFMFEFLKDHTSVIKQYEISEMGYTGRLNPYTLGFNIFQDIKRICEEPTQEDKEWFPDLAGTDYVEAVKFAVKSFKNSSFIYQYLSPHLIRKMRMLEIQDNEKLDWFVISEIHDDEGYKKIRRTLSEQFELSNLIPDMQVFEADIRGERILTLRSVMRNGRSLDEDTVLPVLSAIEFLWGYEVELYIEDDEGTQLSKYSI